MLYRLSASDARLYNAMEDSGASALQLEEFYMANRRKERNHIAALMSHEDRDRFQRLLVRQSEPMSSFFIRPSTLARKAQEASHLELDNCFDDIKRVTELREQARTTKSMWFDNEEWPANKNCSPKPGGGRLRERCSLDLITSETPVYASSFREIYLRQQAKKSFIRCLTCPHGNSGRSGKKKEGR